MTDEEKETRKMRVANRKFIRDSADYAFRVVQMWIVLALVLYMQRQTGSNFAAFVMFALTIALFLYCMYSPVNMLEEWEIARGKEGHGLVYVAVLLGGVAFFVPLLASDVIIDEMNRVAHGTASSPAAQTPHGGH